MYCRMSFENVFNEVSFAPLTARASINLCATTACLTVQYSSKTYLKTGINFHNTSFIQIVLRESELLEEKNLLK